MKPKLPLLLASLFLIPAAATAQRRPGPGPAGGPPERGPRPEQLGESEAELGSSGIVWYPILDDGLAEAKRTGKPILFMSVSSSCNGISGVF